MLKPNLSDAVSTGSAFTFLSTSMEAIPGEFTSQAVAVGLSLIIGIIAKLVSKLFASIFTKKKLTNEEILQTIEDQIRKEFEKKGVPFNEADVERLTVEAASKLSKKLVK